MGFRDILIANRGEIAIRIAQAAAELGLATTAVFAQDDAGSLHLNAADRALPLTGRGTRAYLDIEAMIATARHLGAIDFLVKPIAPDGLEKVIRETRGIVLVSFSALNVDRFVTFFRASKRTKRLFLADVYSAEVLLAAGNAKLPDPRKGTMGIFLPAKMKLKIVREGNARVASKYRPHRIFPEQLRDYPRPLMMAFRDSLQRDLEQADCLADGTLIYSYWPGYLERGRIDPRDWCKKHGLRFELLHVSGHADPETLDQLIDGVQPRRLVPIHTEAPEYFLKRYRMAEAWADGEEHTV